MEPSAPFRVADWYVDPAVGRIRRGDHEVRLEPKVMELLVYLSSRPGAVISREELEAAIWTGTVVGYDAVTGSIQKLRRAFEDSARTPAIIETVSKRGYRLIATVRPADESGEGLQERASAAMSPSLADRRTRGRGFLAVAVGVVVGIGLWFGIWHETGRSIPTRSAKPAIAVLPLENLGGDPDEQFFADGMTDDLITELTKTAGLFVISRDSSFHYRGKTVDVRRVGSELGVQYVLHGSVRRSADRIRLNIALTDTASGGQLWAERYDSGASSVFEMQDLLMQSILEALAIKLSEAERKRLARRDTGDLQAYENYLRGEALFYRYARESNTESRGFFEKAIRLDPEFARAHAMIAWAHALDFMNGWSDSQQRSLALSEQRATQALTLNEALPVAYFVKGLVYRQRREYTKALTEAEKAIAFDPSYANAHVLQATLLYYTGRPQEGLDRMRKAAKLNPHYPANYPFHMGQAHFILGHYVEAIDLFKKGLAQNPTSERLRVWLAAAYACAGDVDAAKWEMEQVRLANPQFSLERMAGAFPFSDPKDLERFLDGLRKAQLSG